MVRYLLLVKRIRKRNTFSIAYPIFVRNHREERQVENLFVRLSKLLLIPKIRIDNTDSWRYNNTKKQTY